MDIDLLQRQLKRPELHQKLLSGYKGAYSLGIGSDPQSDEPVLILQVEEANDESFPTTVKLAGEKVRVIINKNFQRPVPY
jgi:hypothetical protein